MNASLLCEAQNSGYQLWFRNQKSEELWRGGNSRPFPPGWKMTPISRHQKIGFGCFCTF